VVPSFLGTITLAFLQLGTLSSPHNQSAFANNPTDASKDLPAMGAKQKGSSKPKGNQAEEVEETLQAVVLADTFETRFEPFTLDQPRVCT
jgi:hypothetical protein